MLVSTNVEMTCEKFEEKEISLWWNREWLSIDIVQLRNLGMLVKCDMKCNEIDFRFREAQKVYKTESTSR